MLAVRRLPVVADMTLVTAGAMTANVAGYLLQLLAGRWLGVAGYSEFASLLAVQLLAAVPALALQNVVARELVRGAAMAAVRRLTRHCAVIVAVAAIVLIPVVALVLQVDPLAAGGALLAAPVLVVISGEQGVLQGRNQFRWLAVVLGGVAILRVVPAVVVLAAGGHAAPALWAAALGLLMAAAIAHGVTRGMQVVPDGSGTDPAGIAAVLRAAQVQAALMALSSADLIIARIVLDDADASRYALGAIATKIAFWLPQAVGVVLYPRMAQPQHSVRALRSALAVLAVIGLVAVAGAAVLSPLAPAFAGSDYAPIQGWLWLFALDGALLAVLQGALLSTIAADRTAPAAVIWFGLAIELAIALPLVRSLPLLITAATGITAATTISVVALVVRAVRGDGNSALPRSGDEQVYSLPGD